MNTAIILSGGTGTRLGGDTPKQYIKVKDKMLIEYSVEAIHRCPSMDALVVVAANERRGEIEKCIPKDGSITFIGFADPGETRQLSILNALRFIAENAKEGDGADLVLIHDAARPNVTPELINELIKAAKDREGAMPVLPMKDTVYISKDQKTVTGLIDRKTVFAGQAPEVFRFEKYLKANEALLPDRIREINGSSEPAVLAGMDIALIPGDENNYKITTAEDLKRFTDEGCKP